MKKYLFSLFSTIVLFGTGVEGQSAFEAQWRHIDGLIESRSYKDAFTAATNAVADARRDGSSIDMLIGTWYQGRIAFAYQDDPFDSSLARYEALLPQLQPVDQMVCHMLLAEIYENYSSNANLEEMARKDTLQKHREGALANPDLLKQTSAIPYRRLCEQGSAPGIRQLFLTPTLYDVVVRMLMDNLSEAEQLPWIERLRQFHQDDTIVPLKIFLDNEYLTTLGMVPNTPKVTIAQWKGLIEKYRGDQSEQMARLYYRVAEMYSIKGQYVEALNYCDTLIKEFKMGSSVSEAQMMRERITKSVVNFDEVQMGLDEQYQFCHLSFRNCDSLFFRIVEYKRYSNVNQLLDFTVLKKWSQQATNPGDYSYQEGYAYLPPMPAGHYYIIASPTEVFREENFAYMEYSCGDATIVSASNSGSRYGAGFLVNRISGKPIEGVTLKLERRISWDEYKHVATQKTDKDGYYDFTKNCEEDKTYRIVLSYNGYNQYFDGGFSATQTTSVSKHIEVMLDRPVYKLGETVSFSILCYKSDGKKVGEVMGDKKLRCRLFDVNYREIWADTLRTTPDGLAHGTCEIPKDLLPGSYRLNVDMLGEYCSTAKYINVEEYKQPRFTVSIKGDAREHHFGEEVHVEGQAVSLVGMPIDNATVTYRVERVAYRPYWFRYWYDFESENTVVASGETTTDAQGLFDFTFVPQPDSSVDFARKPSFSYVVSVIVAERGGETHDQTTEIHVGFVTRSLLLTGEQQVKGLEDVTFRYCNLDGQPLEGKMQVKVERLARPQNPLMVHPSSKAGLPHTMGEDEFGKKFPGFAYRPEDMDPDQWKATQVVQTLDAEATALAGGHCAIKPLSDGCYRITVVDKSDTAIKDTRTVVVTTDRASQLQEVSLLWSDISATTAQPGETVTLRVGSSFQNVKVRYAIYKGFELLKRSAMTLNGNIQTIAIPVDTTMYGGLSVSLSVVYQGQTDEKRYTISVPYAHKKLKTHFVAFRDKLLPGAQEQWTLRVEDNDSNPAQYAAMVLSLYDAALDHYGTLGWSLWPWRSNSVARPFACQIPIYSGSSNYRYSYAHYYSEQPVVWRLTSNLYAYYRERYRVGFARKQSNMVECMPMPCVEAPVEKAREDVEEMSYMVNDAAPQMASKAAANGVEEEEMADEAVAGGADNGAAEPEPQVRQNLNTLAFFKPEVLCDSNGVATITFTVPELLTRWHLQGLAFTRDLRSSTFENFLVTTKPLMAEPQMPRFFRQGDKVLLAVKLSNTTENPLTTTVRLDLADVATGSAWGEWKPETVTVAPMRSEVVTFAVDVPYNSFAVQYKVVATANGEEGSCSDGEQGVAPVASNRTLVTESQAMYVNGAGEKTYQLPNLQSTDTRVPHLLAVEFTSNPIWYAIQSLPYVKDHSNPSHIYMVNQFYVNTVGERLVRQFPQIKQVFEEWEQDTITPVQSRLSMNEDIKQTLLEECPFLRDAMGEEQRVKEIAQFFDEKAIEKNLSDLVDKLTKGQRTDGSWSWIPGGEYSSEYTTRYIVTRLGELPESERKTLKKAVNNAMRYIDAKVAEDYRNYKKYKITDAIDADYLYLRSLYPSYKPANLVTREAYTYYLKNAKKHCLKMSGLYSRAQMAQVMYRAGEKKLAEKLIEQLRQSSLQSDEMGMYWRDNVSGFLWNERPIEVQSELIRAFEEVSVRDTESVGLMRQWLLKQKQTTSWSSDISTLAAITALLPPGTELSKGVPATVKVNGEAVAAHAQSGTGYISKRWNLEDTAQTALLQPAGNTVTIQQEEKSIGWGAAYWQYYEDLDKVPATSMGITLSRVYLKVADDGSVSEIKEGEALAIGTRIRVQTMISCDRNLEFLQLREHRPAGTEPVNTASGWRWSDGLRYYAAVTNTGADYYIDRLDKGRYVVTYELFATQAGTFSSGISVMQSLYAPEFRATAAGQKITIRK